MRCLIVYFFCFVSIIAGIHASFAADDGWYTEGNFAPSTRIEIELVNTKISKVDSVLSILSNISKGMEEISGDWEALKLEFEQKIAK